MEPKYRVLAELVKTSSESSGDDMIGNYWVIVGVIKLIAEEWGQTDDLKDALYYLIADAFAPAKPDEA